MKILAVRKKMDVRKCPTHKEILVESVTHPSNVTVGHTDKVMDTDRRTEQTGAPGRTCLTHLILFKIMTLFT